MPVHIRYVTPEDAVRIADFSRQTFYDTFVATNSRENMEKFMNEQFNRERLVEEVGAPGNTFFMAMDGEEIAGYVRLRENNNPPELVGQKTLEIARLYSATDRIGKGIGNILMEECLVVAREKAVPLLWLGVWEYNERAIAFYRRWGFEKFGTHIFKLGDDLQTDWLMKKNVSA